MLNATTAVSISSQSNATSAVTDPPLAAEQPLADRVRGKADQSVGHQAKAAVAAAEAAGLDLPRNAQGVAASQIARGADAAQIFAERVSDQVPVLEDSGPLDETGPLEAPATVESTPPPPSAEIATDAPATEAPKIATGFEISASIELSLLYTSPAISPGYASSAETALDLLA